MTEPRNADDVAKDPEDRPDVEETAGESVEDSDVFETEED